MLTKLSKILALGFLLSATVGAKAQHGRCLIDTGNACLKTCGEFANLQYDLGTPDASGSYVETRFVAECYPCEGDSCVVQCSYNGDGINVEGNNSACGGGDSIVADATALKALQQVSKSHPILVADCGGGLYPLSGRQATRERIWSPGSRKGRISDLIPNSAGGR